MRYIIKVLALSICSWLISCASTVQLSSNAKSLHDHMTAQQAESVVATFARPDATRGGVCLFGVHVVLTQLNYDKPVSVSGSVIHFNAYYAAPGASSVTGNVAAGTGRLKMTYIAVPATSVVDVRTLHEVRVLETNPNVIGICKHFKPGYIVALKPDQGLPDQAEISVNAASHTDLDSLLAALTVLSPQAKVKGGLGM